MVASEVKQLAAQTAEATREISQKIEAIQLDSAEVVESTSEIGDVIMRIHDLQNSIAAAVEQQSATTAEVDRSAGHAAKDAATIAERIASVAQSAAETTEGARSAEYSAKELADMVAQLRSLIDQFTYDVD